jgi:hypothetical protein
MRPTLIFMESTASAQKLIDALKTALAKELAAIDAGISRLGWMRSGLTGAGLFFVAGVALYFGRAVTNQAGKGAPTDGPDVSRSAATGEDRHGRHLSGCGRPSVQLPPVMRPANLIAAAEHLRGSWPCHGIWRGAGAAGPRRLGPRCAGIVLWAIDSDGARLHPSILGHGYPEKVVRKLRPLQIDADNVTSLAFRFHPAADH